MACFNLFIAVAGSLVLVPFMSIVQLHFFVEDKKVAGIPFDNQGINVLFEVIHP